MLSKMMVCTSNALYEATSKMKAKLHSKDGMELLQMVILIGIALALGGLIMVFLRAWFGNEDAPFWTQFRTRLNAILG